MRSDSLLSIRLAGAKDFPEGGSAAQMPVRKELPEGSAAQMPTQKDFPEGSAAQLPAKNAKKVRFSPTEPTPVSAAELFQRAAVRASITIMQVSCTSPSFARLCLLALVKGRS